ncbi:MAG: Di-glucose binding within endoplasmic reticulum [Bacteroidetes bacterium ADurb.Bin217]|nr:MAG: Di-glucose binding within endoplasmic reticulum [Bacteroidetes bacterium ADurb.Bin217]
MYIERGYTVTVTADAACTSVTIGTNTSGANSTLTFNSGQTLTVSGNITVGYNSSYQGTINMNSGGTLKIGGVLTLTASSYTFSTNSGNSGTVEYTATAGGQSIRPISYYNLTLSNTSGTNTATGNISVNGTLITTSGGTFAMSTYQLTGNLNTITNNGTISTQNTSNPAIPANKSWGGTIVFAKADGGQNVPSGSTFTNVTFSNTSGTNTAQGQIQYTGTGTFTTTSGGTLAMGSNSLSVYNFTNAGTITSSSTIAINNTVNNTGTLTLSNNNPLPTGKIWGGTVNYSNTSGNQTVAQGTYNNLTCSNTSNTNTINGNIVVNGTLTTTSGGTLSLSSSSYNLSGTLSTITNNGTILIPNTNATPLPTGKTWGGKVKFDASGAIMVAGTYNNVDINNNVTVSGAVSIGGVLNWTNNGKITTTAVNTITITNTSTAAITNYNSSRFISGPLSLTIAANLTSSANNYVFPIGKGTNTTDYYPYSITTLTTGASAPVLTVEVFKSNAGGSADGTTLGSLSTGEYWLASFTGNYTNGSVSLSRGDNSLSGLSGIGRSATQGGTYTSLGGTVSGNAVNTSSLTSNSLGYFVLAKLPFYSRQSGNWSDATTWSNASCGGAAASSAPGSGDIVTICGGNVVTVYDNTSPSISKLTVTGSGSTLQMSTNIWEDSFTVTGNTYIDEGGSILGSTNTQKYTYTFNYLYIGTNTTSSVTSSLVMNQSNQQCNVTVSGMLVLGNCAGTGTAVFNYSPTLTIASTLNIANRMVHDNGTYTFGCSGTCPSNPSTTTASDCSVITVSETTRTGFSYCTGNGPSAYQAYTVSGSNLSEDITVTAPTNYEISISSGSGYGASLTLTESSGTVTTTTIYVRLKAGLGVAAYNGEVISHTSTGATTKNVTCSGSVVSGTSITVSSATVTGFSGCDGSASSAQTYTVSGQCLSGDITITPPSDYQISVDNFNWVTSPTTIALSPSSGNVGVTTIYVRLRPGLTVNSYNAQVITHTGGGAAQQNVTCSGSIYAYPTANAGADIYVCNSTFYQVNATSVAYSPYVASGAYVSGGSDDNQGGAIDRTNVVNPAPEGVYQTGRNGAHDYTFTGLTSGNIYLIRLHFSEHWGAPGQRQFNVAINGVSKLTNFDINVAAGGLNKAVVREFYVAANGSGQIIVSFTNGAANTALSRGVELYNTGQLTASGGGTYAWSTGETSQSIYVGPSEATYTVTVTTNGCSSQDAVQVAEGCGTPAPFLIAASNASVDAPFEVTFTDNAPWRAAVTSVTIDGTPLTAGYVISSGKITFTPSASNPAGLLQASGTKTIRVIATGYTNTAVSQTINPGAATKLAMKTQPVAPAANGAVLATQPQVYLQDQYSNVTTSNAVVTAAVGAGTWTIGGTLTKTGSLGTAAFANLSASAAGAVTGATITFTSPGLTSVTSATFNIPDLPSITIASPSQTGASNIEKNSTKQVISAFTIAVATASTQLQTLTFTTAGTYAASDVVNFKLWYHSSNDITAATQLGGEITSGLGAGSHTFSNLSHAIASGVTEYIWITVDVAEHANYGKTINAASIANADITFASGTKSGSVTAGGTKTIVLTTALTGFNYIGAGPSKYQSFNLASTGLSPASGTITVTAPTNYEISKSPNSGYGASLNYTYNSSTLSENDGIMYVRLKAGLSAGTDYNGENITFSGDGGYNALTVSCSGGVGQIYYFRQTGNWTEGNTWSLSCNGGAAGSYPTYKDSAVCACTGMKYDAGYTLTVDADLTVGAIYIDRKLDISSNNVTLTVKNTLQLGKTDTWSEGQGSINVGDGTLIVEGDLILGYNNDSNGLKWDNGNIYVGGNLICSDGGGPSPLEAGTDAYQNLSLRPGGGPESDPWAGTVPTYAGSIIMTGENKSIQVNAAAVDLVRIKLESSTISKTGNGTLYITENIDFNGQTAFENSVGSVIISGTITNAENATLTNDAIVKIATSTNNLAVHSGTAGSTTEYNSVGDEPVNIGTYYNLTISGGGTKTLQGDITINHQLYFPDAGYIDLNGYDLTMNDWEDGNIYPITSADRYIISSNGTFVINGVGVGETANFPIGLSAADADFARVDIENNDGTRSFTVTGLCDGLYSDGTCGGTNGGYRATKQAVDLTWFITSASTNATMTLYWHTSRHLTDFSTTSCAVFHYGSNWELRPTQGAVSTYDGSYRYKTGTINSFSPFSVQNGEGLLPIELVSFSAKQKPLGTLLEWETASEQNNEFFTVYRSNNGIQFDPIAQIAGSGNSSHSQYYSYFDASVFPGITYYQLSQTDYDGTISFSDIVSTIVELPNFELISFAYTKANQSVLEIQFSDYDAENTIRIVDLLGKVMYEQTFTKTTYERIEIDLPIGTYTLFNTNDSSVYSQKILVKK